MNKFDLEDTKLLDNIGNGGSEATVITKRTGMTKLEAFKWLGAAFILSSAIMAAYSIIPFNFLIQGIGIAIWCIAGYIMKDRPLFWLNLVSSTLTFIAFFSNL